MGVIYGEPRGVLLRNTPDRGIAPTMLARALDRVLGTDFKGTAEQRTDTRRLTQIVAGPRVRLTAKEPGDEPTF